MFGQSYNPGFPLDRSTQEQMEHHFGECFDKVRIHFSPQIPGSQTGKALACTVATDIYMKPGCYRPEKAWGRRLLVHELAHVVQKQQPIPAPGKAASVVDLETEAHAAAIAYESGKTFRCALSDQASIARYWGEAGHYYTAYLMMLMAGANNTDAQQMAFYAQMPDEVNELDAVAQAIRHTAKTTFENTRTGRIYAAAQEAVDLATGENNHLSLAESWDQMLVVQEGIHCLTGRNSAEETERRRNNLINAAFPSFEFGLGIHSYGDSFSHRKLGNESEMYGGYIGHGLDRHAPDHIHERRDLYREYGSGLFQIVHEKLHGAMSTEGQQYGVVEVEAFLDEISSQSGDSAQIAKMREIASVTLGQPMDTYTPETQDTEDWEDFWPRTGTSFHLRSSAMQHGVRWR